MWRGGARVRRRLRGYALTVIKSTVPVGTHLIVRREVEAATAGRADASFDIASIPEILKEGAAIKGLLCRPTAWL